MKYWIGVLDGDIILRIDDKTVRIKEPFEEHSWLRIPKDWAYYYPSKDSPMLGDYLPREELEFEITYHDINDKKYKLHKRRLKLIEPPETGEQIKRGVD